MLFALAALTNLACEKKAPGEEKATKAAPARPAPKEGSAPAPAEPSDSMKSADQEAIQSLIAAWQRSQNQGDFESYQKLYAERFVGIKRVGSRSSQADRTGWLKDRKAMFGRPMTVEAKDVALTGGSTFVRARFTQTFRTPTFKDEGSKELRFARSASGWQIVHEEMLTSSTGKPSIRGPEISSGEFSFVRDAPDGTLILLERYASLNPVFGKLVYLDDGVFTRPVKQELVEERFRRFLGKPFVVYDASGASCEVTPNELIIYGESYPHFGTLNIWNGEVAGEPKLGFDERALAAWRMVGDERWMALKASQRCEGTWARLKDAPPPELYRAIKDVPIAPRAVNAFEGTAGFEALRAYAQANPQAPALLRKEMVAFESANGAQFIGIAAEAGEGYCSEFGGRHFGFFRRSGDAVQLMSDPKESYVAPTLLTRSYNLVREPWLPVAAIDVNQDGIPELLFKDSLFAFNGSSYALAREARVADFDCPC